VTIRTPANRANADGIDIDSMTNATVINSSVNAGDDGIAVKTNSGAASNMTIKNSRFFGTHGISIGSQTFHGVTNILFTGNYVYGTDLNGIAATTQDAIRVKSDVDCGGHVDRVTYTNTCITGAKHLIVLDTMYGSCSGTNGNPVFTNIVVNGAFATKSVSGAYTRIRGLDSSHLIDAYLAHVSFDATSQSSDQDAQVALNASNITPSGSGIQTRTFTLSGSVPTCAF
jgi:polygalacturonase